MMTLKKIGVVLCLVVLSFIALPAGAETLTLTLSSGDPAVAYTDANGYPRDPANVFRVPVQDAQGNWGYGPAQDAYLVPTLTWAWGTPPVNSSWINWMPTNSDPGTGYGNPPIKYLATFVLPDNFRNASLSFQIQSDDWVEIGLNNTVIFRTFLDNLAMTGPLYTPICNGQSAAFFSCPQTLSMANGLLTNVSFVPGVNTLVFDNYGPDVISGLNYVATITYEKVKTVEDLTNRIRDMINAITGLPSSAFKNENMRNAFMNKLNAVLKQVQNGDFQGALQKMTNDIAAKMNGCAASGAPDNNDWIIDCEMQGKVYSIAQDIIALLVYFNQPVPGSGL